MFAVLLAAGCAPNEDAKSSNTEKVAERAEPPIKSPQRRVSVPFEQAVKEKGMEMSDLEMIQLDVRGKGEVTIAVARNLAPKTVEQIMQLVSGGFYDGQAFHRVEDWVVQWGSPMSKEFEKNKDNPEMGAGGSGSQLPFEDNDILQTRGVVAMARVADKPNGDSQMYILRTDRPGLSRNYVAFGYVIGGMDVVDKIEVGDKLSMRIIKK
jgi:cyclophilin family peptidyl-prolyl cis-trans isomerase